MLTSLSSWLLEIEYGAAVETRNDQTTKALVREERGLHDCRTNAPSVAARSTVSLTLCSETHPQPDLARTTDSGAYAYLNVACQQVCVFDVQGGGGPILLVQRALCV